MKNSLFFVMACIILLLACQNNPATMHADEHNDTTLSAPDHDPHAGKVSLNNGEKWVANPETTEGIIKMKSLVTGFTRQPTTEDYTALKKKLDSELNLIIQKCTMTGEAHEQLHKYLIPMTEMLKSMDAANTEVRDKSFTDLKQHLNNYEYYFQ
jgi:hypothetical protein